VRVLVYIPTTTADGVEIPQADRLTWVSRGRDMLLKWSSFVVRHEGVVSWSQGPGDPVWDEPVTILFAECEEKYPAVRAAVTEWCKGVADALSQGGVMCHINDEEVMV